ncbi:hypothetical protein SELMODRAFT_415024 [Selaginella moellendorffii]|uniref:CBM20 domain-containing protein n=1 Tax=Selaginella moellendorffii TaxID=88036 RepID=D8RUD2_SELML|nr:hypothetical protein SELMODRAFT_415024 [Selaginella moellendorffii]
MASANAPYATLYNQPKYESRKQADLPPWEKEQWAWKKSKTCNSGGPNVGATPDLITPEPLPPAVPPAVSPVPCAQSAPFGTEENMANHTDKPDADTIAENNRAPWEREESPYFSKVGNENGGSASSGGGRDGVTRVKFVLQRQCMFGEHFKVIGGHPALGEWDPRAAIPLEWSDGHNWTTELDVPQGSVFEYKFVLQCQNGWIHWQPGPNRVFSTPEKKPSLVVSQTWDFDAKGMEDGDATEAREESLSGAEAARGKNMLETEAPQETMPDTRAREESLSGAEEAREKSMLETEAPQETMPDTEAREEGTALASEGGDQAAISSLESRQLGEQAGSDSEQEEQEEQEQAFEALTQCIELPGGRPDTLPNFDSAKERNVIELQVSEIVIRMKSMSAQRRPKNLVSNAA